jgi:hypothetical protein
VEDDRYRLRSRANLRSRSRSAVGGYAVSVKAEPVEEHKESGIILDLTRCGQRLNNRAAILQSKITRWGREFIPG